jgi:hypothetical protein
MVGAKAAGIEQGGAGTQVGGTHAPGHADESRRIHSSTKAMFFCAEHHQYRLICPKKTPLNGGERDTR